MATFELGSCMAQLWHADLEQRLEAVTRLRELGEPAAGAELLVCLEQEFEKQGSWDLQRGLISALGACGYQPALEVLKRMRAAGELTSEVEEAIGMAWVQLSATHPHDVGPVLALMAEQRPKLTQGALQAMARMRMVPDEESMRVLVEYALGVDLASEAWALIWIMRAAPGWSGPERDRLLEHYSAPEYEQLRQLRSAVLLAQEGEYKRWGQF